MDIKNNKHFFPTHTDGTEMTHEEICEYVKTLPLAEGNNKAKVHHMGCTLEEYLEKTGYITLADYAKKRGF